MKHVIVSGIIGVAIAGAIGYYGLHLPQQQRVASIAAQIETETADQQTRTDVARLIEGVSQYHRRFPSEADPTWLSREVVKLGRDAGLELTSITQEEPRSAKPFTRLTVKVAFTATYHQLGVLLDRIEHAQPFILIDQVDVTPTDSRRRTDAAVTLTLSTYHLPPVDTRHGLGTETET